MQIQSVYEFAWLTTLQVVVTTDKEGVNIKGFGSGFFFQYKGKSFFITADHVTHPDDFEVGLRLGKDDYLWVFNNKNGTTELGTLLTPIGGLYSFDLMNINDELSFEIPDMKDISFALLPESFKYPFLTHELSVREHVIVPAGEQKVIIKEECASELTKSDYCLVEGCVHWGIVGGIKFDRKNAIYDDLTLVDIDKEGYYIMKPTLPVIYKDWAGLSGGPIFNNSFRLIGMIIEVSEETDLIRVIPIKKITELMDYALKYEESQIDKETVKL